MMSFLCPSYKAAGLLFHEQMYFLYETIHPKAHGLFLEREIDKFCEIVSPQVNFYLVTLY